MMLVSGAGSCCDPCDPCCDDGHGPKRRKNNNGYGNGAGGVDGQLHDVGVQCTHDPVHVEVGGILQAGPLALLAVPRQVDGQQDAGARGPDRGGANRGRAGGGGPRRTRPPNPGSVVLS